MAQVESFRAEGAFLLQDPSLAQHPSGGADMPKRLCKLKRQTIIPSFKVAYSYQGYLPCYQ